MADEGVEHCGQGELERCEVTCTKTSSGVWLTEVSSRPSGKGNNGDEGINFLEKRFLGWLEQIFEEIHENITFASPKSWMSQEYLIEAERSIVPAACISCGSDQVYRHGCKRQLYLDTPVHGKRSAVLVHRRRFLCQSCRRSFFEPLPQMSPTHFMTQRLVDYIEQQALRQTFVSVAQLVGVTEGTVRQVFAAYQKRQQQDIRLRAPSQIGIDEVKIDGAMRAVVVDTEHHRILDILPDRKKGTVLNFLLQLEGADAIAWVTMDMWKSYLEVARQALPQARVAVDKFHVVRLANRGLEAVRKRIRRSLSDQQRKTLMHDKYILLHRRADLSESQVLILEAWTKNLPELGTAYDLKESYCDVWAASTRAEAMALYQAWRSRVPAHLEEDFKPLLTAMSNWEVEILNHFEAGLTNAYTEALNGIIKGLVHRSRGASLEKSSGRRSACMAASISPLSRYVLSAGKNGNGNKHPMLSLPYMG